MSINPYRRHFCEPFWVATSMNLRKGVKLVESIEGTGQAVERRQYYIFAIRLTLNQGDLIKTPNRCLSHTIDDTLKVNDDGFFEHRVRIDRENLVPGIFYAVQGMKVGGYRKVIISPHLAYGEKGIPGLIPKFGDSVNSSELVR